MILEKDVKQKWIAQFARTPTDTGSPEVQIAILTQKIKILTEHLKKHYHDFSSKRGLLKMVSQRRKFLKYLERTNNDQYYKVLQDLNLKELKR